jgi:hypothetical protein
VLILGSLTVTGRLKLEQRHDLFVKQGIVAQSIRGASANLVVGGSVNASDLFCVDMSESGALYVGQGTTTPLYVHFARDRVDMTIDRRPVLENGLVTLRDIVASATSRRVGDTVRELYDEIEACIVAGRGKSLVDKMAQRVVDQEQLVHRGASISELEACYAFQLHPSYREFLTASAQMYGGGMDVVDVQQLVAWGGVSEPAPGRSPPVDEDSSEYWLHDLVDLKLVGGIRAIVDEDYRWGPSLMDKGYPIGEGADGSLYIQSVTGDVYKNPR